MEEEDGDASTPFWLQSRRNNTHFRRTSSLGGRATTVAIQAFFAGAAAILIVFFIIHPFFSSVSQFLRPHLVRKSWDYLNFVLVLFAVICGFLSRNTDNDESSNHNKEEVGKNNERGVRVSTPRYWIDDHGGDQFPDQTVYKRRFSSLRSSSSYPDLRLGEIESDERWRFYDDTRVSRCRYESSDPPIYRAGSGFETEKAEVVEELSAPSNPLPQPSAPPYPLSPPPSPPRAPPPSKPAKRRTKRVYQDVAAKEEKKQSGDSVAAATPLITPVPVPESSKHEKKKGGGATKDFLIALRKKKKKQRQQSIDGLDLLFGSDSPFDYSPPPPPPPPPFFQSKRGKTKKLDQIRRLLLRHLHHIGAMNHAHQRRRYTKPR
ncbi:hydroxyproline-rich glycoprotein family protein [Raphanus sativus]|nr:hydroxyproline-rich glycoprotein family protein [Raphanus sativus]